MDIPGISIKQPVTVAVGIVIVIMAGLVALRRIPIQLTPTVDDMVVSVTTMWEGASPEEIEQQVIDKQEERLRAVAGVRKMTSKSVQGQGSIRLEFQTGTPKELAMREVSDKLREVPEYPDNVDEPVVLPSDPWNRDFIAWFIFSTTDPDLDVRTLNDFAEDRVKPVLERVAGVSEIMVLGGRERELQIIFDPLTLANRGVTPSQLVNAIRGTNTNVSAGELSDGKLDVRVRTVGQYASVADVERTVISQTEMGGPVLLGSVARVVETYKEPFGFVRSKGKIAIALNAQREVGSNVMQVMKDLRAAVESLRLPGGILESEERRLGLKGKLDLEMVYDQTVYIDDALALVQSNIVFGGALAVSVLFLFLRSIRAVGVIALAIPISIIGSVVAMVAMGRTVNVISLAGMAFAVGMVVDNAIVVLENIHRHVEMGKTPFKASLDATREVSGAVLASTLTTIFVFIPILLIQEEVGQLFRDIALAICAAVGLSYAVAVTVIPSASARILKHKSSTPKKDRLAWLAFPALLMEKAFGWFPAALRGMILILSKSTLACLGVVSALCAFSIIGGYLVMPSVDYLPSGNRNLTFGVILAPPGYNIDKKIELGTRVEATVRPFWEAGEFPVGSPEYMRAVEALPEIPTFSWTGEPGQPIKPSPLDNYFFVGFDASIFHGAISSEPAKAADTAVLLNYATRGDVLPGSFGFAFQMPLFNTGTGGAGSSLSIDFSGDNLDEVTRVAGMMMGELMAAFPGGQPPQPEPGNFNIPGPEHMIVPDLKRLAEVGMLPSDLGLAVLAAGDGAIIGEYRIGGETIDIKLIAEKNDESSGLDDLEQVPIATPGGMIVPLGTIARVEHVPSKVEIQRVNRQRAVTLTITPPNGVALDDATAQVSAMIEEKRAAGLIPPTVLTQFTGNASKLRGVKEALLGDGSFFGLLGSSLFLALAVTYLLLCVLFQSFLKPVVIMLSVPPATLGGFAALKAVQIYSEMDRHMPIQQLDVLTMLGFVVLIGIVVNNAILIVAQADNILAGGDSEALAGKRVTPELAIAEAVRTRVRPIFMSSLTSILGLAPLVILPGAGSELYRGLGAVVLGGLLVSTFFTLILVPLFLVIVLRFRAWLFAALSRGASVAGMPAAK